MTTPLFNKSLPSSSSVETTRFPLLNHVTLGSGEPRAEQFSVTASPTLPTSILLGGLETI